MPEVTTPTVETPVKTVTETRRSGRVIEPPEWFHNEIFILEEDEHAHYMEAIATLISKNGSEPCNLKWSPCTRIKFGTWLILQRV